MKNENSAHSFTEGCDVYSQPENVLTYGDLLRLKALNDELLYALEKLLMATEYSRYVQKSATLEQSMITAKVLINKAKAQ